MTKFQSILEDHIFEIYEAWVEAGSIENKEIVFIERKEKNDNLLNKLRKKLTVIAALSNLEISTSLLNFNFKNIKNGYLHVIITKNI